MRDELTMCICCIMFPEFSYPASPSGIPYRYGDSCSVGDCLHIKSTSVYRIHYFSHLQSVKHRSFACQTRIKHRSSLVHFASIGAAPPQLVELSRGSKSNAGNMDRTWSRSNTRNHTLLYCVKSELRALEHKFDMQGIWNHRIQPKYGQ